MIQVHQIRKYLKANKDLSIKKGSSRPQSLNTKKQELKRQLFWVLLACKLGEIRILINIHVSSFSRDTKKETTTGWWKENRDKLQILCIEGL